MAFIASFWWLWLILTVACWGYAFFNQARRMKRMWERPAGDGFFAGLGPLVVVGLIGVGANVLLVIAIMAHLIRYAQGLG